MTGIARIFIQAQDEQNQIRDQHRENWSAKLALESEQIAAQDIAHGERCGEEQFQGPTAAMIDEMAARFRREPNL
jgi:hypothetical protein